MIKKKIVWCSHPIHGGLLPNGKKKGRKVGLRPSHPKGKMRLSQKLAIFINEHNHSILNKTSEKLVEGNYLCTKCFRDEEDRLMYPGETDLNDGVDCDDELISPVNHDSVSAQQSYAKMKLNQVFECTNIQIIDDM